MLVAVEHFGVLLKELIGPTAASIASRTSAALGQMSFRNTGLPCRVGPRGSGQVRSMSTVPARAKATTSGGDAR